MKIKRLPIIIDCDRIWADLVTLVYRLRRKPRVTYFMPPLRKAVSASDTQAKP